MLTIRLRTAEDILELVRYCIEAADKGIFVAPPEVLHRILDDILAANRKLRQEFKEEVYGIRADHDGSAVQTVRDSEDKGVGGHGDSLSPGEVRGGGCLH